MCNSTQRNKLAYYLGNRKKMFASVLMHSLIRHAAWVIINGQYFSSQNLFYWLVYEQRMLYLVPFSGDHITLPKDWPEPLNSLGCDLIMSFPRGPRSNGCDHGEPFLCNALRWRCVSKMAKFRVSINRVFHRLWYCEWEWIVLLLKKINIYNRTHCLETLPTPTHPAQRDALKYVCSLIFIRLAGSMLNRWEEKRPRRTKVGGWSRGKKSKWLVYELVNFARSDRVSNAPLIIVSERVS